MGIVFGLADHEHHSGAVQFGMVERGQGIGHVHPFATAGRIDLKRFLESGAQTQTTGYLNAQHTILLPVGLEKESAVAIKQVFQVGLTHVIVCHTLYRHHRLLSVLHNQRLVFKHRCEHLNLRHLFQAEKSLIIRIDGASFGQRDTQLGVEGRKQTSHQILKAVEDAQRADQRQGGHCYANRRYARNDIDGIVAATAEKITAGKEKRPVHLRNSSSM